MTRLSVVGLGKLGAPMAACLASRGFEVVGIDLDERKVSRLAALEPPIYEPGLAELLAGLEGRLTATTDLAAAAGTDATFVVVATPSDDEGGFSLRYALAACEAIGAALREKDDYHLVVITSTVMPGATGGELREALERVSGKRCGVDFGLCYSPEFIALGSVIRDFLEPDFVLIGESDPEAGERLAAIYAQVCGAAVPVARLDWVNAEIAKLAVNTFITTKITYANTLARICERIPGADVDEVTAAIGLDSRIGPKYLKGAISYGGPCFPRDNVALARLARDVGAPALLAETTDRVNREQIRGLAELALSKLPPGGQIGVLGLSYKPGTDVAEESPGLLLARALAAEGVDVVAYDPAARPDLGPARLAESAEECIAEADVIVLATPWPEFVSLDEGALGGDGRRRVVIDCWRALDADAVARVADYVPLGRAQPGGVAALTAAD